MSAQTESDSIRDSASCCERSLGQPGCREKLLLIHADDLGLGHSVNQATFAAIDNGIISSASVMVPCPWFTEVAAYVKAHPGLDLGIHLTLTSEWKYYRWGPLTSRERVPSLVDAEGYFWSDAGVAARQAEPDEVETELRAQIESAIKAGFAPTHLDSHMFVLLRSPALFRVFVKLAHEYGLPFRAIRSWNDKPEVSRLFADSDITPDSVILANPTIHPVRWKESYLRVLGLLKPGLSELIVHLGYNDSELQSICMDRLPWGAGWRQRDFDVLTSPEFAAGLKSNDVRVVGWKDLKKEPGQPITERRAGMEMGGSTSGLRAAPVES